MKRHLHSILVMTLALLGLLSPGARASGAWQTYLRPTVFSALLAEGDTVWCATRDAGLLRFTPSTSAFTSFVREPNGLASNRLSSVVHDRSRRLWVGTLGEGASVLSADGSSWSLVNAFDGLPSDSVNTLVADGDTLWIATTRGLALWDGRQVSGVLPDGVNPSPFASDNITGVVLRGDTLWVSTGAGVYFSELSQGLTAWSTANVGLASLKVDAFVTDGTTLFARAAFVAYRWDPATSQWVATSGVGAARTLTAAGGSVFVGGGTGIYRWGGAGWVALDTQLFSTADSPMVATIDRFGQAWAAGRPTSALDVSGCGLFHQPTPGATVNWTFALPPGPPSNSCLNVDLEGDRVYVSTYGLGIGRLRNERWTNWFPSPAGNLGPTTFYHPGYPYAILVDKTSHKWFFCWAPAARGNPCTPDTTVLGVLDILTETSGVDNVTHRLLGPSVARARLSYARGSSADSSGGAWFGLDSPCADELDPAGLEYFTSPADTGITFNSANSTASLPSDLVLSLVTDRDGKVWAGTSKGLCYFYVDSLKAGKPVRRVPIGLNASPDAVRALATRRDTLWFFTSSALWQYSIAGTNRGQYTIPAGPSLQAVRPMDVGLDGTLWLGTSNGIRAYHPGGTYEDFTSANSPLADDEVRTVRVDRSSGRIWIATAGGLSRFDPGFVAASVQLPSLSISVYPNPARLSALGIPVRLSGNGARYVGAIYDVLGRRVSRFSVGSNGRVIWNGRDEHDELVHPGIYFVRAESGGRSAVVRIALLR